MAKILVVDDDTDIVEALSIFLSSYGHEVHSAFTRESGLSAVETINPDLLVLDVVMELPDDGFVLAQELRRRQFKKPIIMLTAVSKVTGMSFGKDDDLVPVDLFVEKPVDMEYLNAKVNELLKK